MKNIVSLLLLLLFSCSTESPTTGISKLPNFIKGTTTIAGSKVQLIRVDLTSEGYVEKSSTTAIANELGEFSFSSFQSGEYVIVAKSNDKIGYKQNITTTGDSIDIGEIYLDDYCSVSGKVVGDNVKNSFVVGVNSAPIIDSSYTLDSIPRGNVDIAISDGEVINVIPVNINGVKSDFKVSSVKFEKEENTKNAKFDYYNHSKTLYTKNFIDDVGDVVSYFPNESGDMVQINTIGAYLLLVDDFEDRDKYAYFNPLSKRTDYVFGVWYCFDDSVALGNSQLLTEFDDFSSIFSVDESNNHYVSFKAVMGDSIFNPYCGFGCNLGNFKKIGMDLSDLTSVTFFARGNCSIEVGLIPNDEFSETETFDYFIDNVTLESSWVKYELSINNFLTRDGSGKTIKGNSWGDIKDDIIYLQFLTKGISGDTLNIDIDNITFNGVQSNF